MMEGEGGAAIANLRIRDGRRLSVFRTYTYPYPYPYMALS
jgi:choline dehydrogenase